MAVNRGMLGPRVERIMDKVCRKRRSMCGVRKGLYALLDLDVTVRKFSTIVIQTDVTHQVVYVTDPNERLRGKKNPSGKIL